jgi:hypothetical protein
MALGRTKNCLHKAKYTANLRKPIRETVVVPSLRYQSIPAILPSFVVHLYTDPHYSI